MRFSLFVMMIPIQLHNFGAGTSKLSKEPWSLSQITAVPNMMLLVIYVGLEEEKYSAICHNLIQMVKFMFSLKCKLSPVNSLEPYCSFLF